MPNCLKPFPSCRYNLSRDALSSVVISGVLLAGLFLPAYSQIKTGMRPQPTPTPTPKLRYIEVSEGAALKGAIKRVYPKCPKQVRCVGKVRVRIAVNASDGVVIDAKAQRVHPLLREAVEKAALAWRFKPADDVFPLGFRSTLAFDLSENQLPK